MARAYCKMVPADYLELEHQSKNVRVTAMQDGKRNVVLIEPEEFARVIEAINVPGLSVEYAKPIELPKRVGSVIRLKTTGHVIVRYDDAWRNASGTAWTVEALEKRLRSGEAVIERGDDQ